jgi:hypothetical protein
MKDPNIQLHLVHIFRICFFQIRPIHSSKAPCSLVVVTKVFIANYKTTRRHNPDIRNPEIIFTQGLLLVREKPMVAIHNLHLCGCVLYYYSLIFSPVALQSLKDLGRPTYRWFLELFRQIISDLRTLIILDKEYKL